MLKFKINISEIFLEVFPEVFLIIRLHLVGHAIYSITPWKDFFGIWVLQGSAVRAIGTKTAIKFICEILLSLKVVKFIHV